MTSEQKHSDGPLRESAKPQNPCSSRAKFQVAVHQNLGGSGTVLPSPGEHVLPPNKRIDQALKLSATVHRPKLYRDRNGKGRPFVALKYRVRNDNGRSRLKSYYVGSVSSEEWQRLQSVVDEASRVTAPSSAGVDASARQNINLLRSLLRIVFARARPIARRCGFCFRGYSLRRKKGSR